MLLKYVVEFSYIPALNLAFKYHCFCIDSYPYKELIKNYTAFSSYVGGNMPEKEGYFIIDDLFAFRDEKFAIGFDLLGMS